MEKIKAVFIAIGAVISSWLGILAIPLFLLLALNVTDYFTGLVAAKYRKELLSSDKGLRGIIKKVCMLLLVGIGAVMDFLIMFAASTLGIKMPFNFVVASVVAVWLICNEILSILENILDIGVDLPPFLKSIASYIKKQAEEKTQLGNANDE